MITKETFDFLREITKNNNREWFTTNKDLYEKVKSNMQLFYDEINFHLHKIDKIGKHKMYRIYRDVRFSSDKSPYKNHFGGIYPRLQPHNRGSFYIHIEPDNSFVGGGFWNPEKEDLLRIRKGIELEEELEVIVNTTEFKSTFHEIHGEKLKTAPKGFEKNHPRIELIQYKQFLLKKDFTNEEVLSPNFSKKVIETYKKMLPFFEYMTFLLTTDENGESIV